MIDIIMRYNLDGNLVDSLDLKSMIVSKGLKVDAKIYSTFSNTHRIFPDPLKCNCFLLPDGVIVHITDVKLHLRYVQKDLMQNLDWIQLKSFFKIRTPFSLSVDQSKSALLLFKGKKVCKVTFFPHSDFYSQKTSNNLPFLGNAVLQGSEWLSFQCLWPCEFAIAGYPCQFCFIGKSYCKLTKKKKRYPRTQNPKDVAEITQYAVKELFPSLRFGFHLEVR